MNRSLTLAQQRRTALERRGGGRVDEGELIFPPEMATETRSIPRGRDSEILRKMRAEWTEKDNRKKKFLKQYRELQQQLPPPRTDRGLNFARTYSPTQLFGSYREARGLARDTSSHYNNPNPMYFYDTLDLSGRMDRDEEGRKREATGLNDKVETLTYKTPKGNKYFFYDRETKKLWETSGNEFRRLNKLRKYDPDDPKIIRKNVKAKKGRKDYWKAYQVGSLTAGRGGENPFGGQGNVFGGRKGDIRDFYVRPASMEDLQLLGDKITSIDKKGLPRSTRRRSLGVNQTEARSKFVKLYGKPEPLLPRQRPSRSRRTAFPTRDRAKGKDFNIKVEMRGKDEGEEVAKFKQSSGLGQYEDRDARHGFNVYTPTEPVFRRTGGRRGFLDTERIDPTPSAQLSLRGLRDPRTAGGNILRGSRTRMGFKSRYQSALEQAVIDRRIRNTIAENKLDEEIKKVKEGEKLKLDNMRLLKETAEQTLEGLKLKNQRLLHDHNVVVRGNQNATLLGSDAEELNKLISSGRISYISVKDMVRKGEISDIATIHQLDFHKGRDQKIKKLVSLMEETADYQVNKAYPFREVNEDGTISIVSGFYQRGGERGSNLQLLMPDGSRKVVRKRDLLDPNDPRLDNLQPITATAPTIDAMSLLSEDSIDSHMELGVRPAQNPSSDLWLGSSLGGADLSGIGQSSQFPSGEGISGGGGRPIKTPSISSSSEDIFGEDEPTPKPEVEDFPDIAVAQYNTILETMGQREAFQRARESELRTLEIPEPKSGILGFGSNASEIERITQRRKQVEDHIRREAKTIKEQKKKANSIAVEKGFAIPFVEGGEDIIPARALLKSMTGESPRPNVSQEQFAQSLEQLRQVQRETGELTEEEEEELEELQPEPEPSISGGLVDVPIEEQAEENVARSEFIKDLQTDDGRNYKVEYMGYPLIVDSQRDEVIDPAGKLPILPLNIFSSPSGNFIRWESETQKIGIENLIREAQKPPPESEPEVGDEKVIGWDRNEVKPSLLKKFAEQNRPNSESMMIWSTRFPDERDTPKKAVFITRDQLEAKLQTLDLGKKERENFLAKFDSEKGKGKTEFAMNNRKIWKGLGLEGTPSASSIVDYRTSVLQLE
tara:strand:+ start:779 stop:4123 length:3345 start_codon:yes stop_codon:yes gene_type:complete